MRNAAAKSISIAMLVLLIGAVNIWGQSSNSINEFDPGTAVMIELPHRFRLDFYTGREKIEDLDSSKIKIGSGISVGIKPVLTRFVDSFDTDKKHVLVLGAAYEYAYASEAGVTKREHKVMADATGRHVFFRNLLFSDRSRFEFRWIDGDYHFRYRNRPKIERPFKIRKRDVTPYIAAEAYWDQRYDNKWNVFKFSGGVEVPIYRRASLDVFYERQHCNTCVDPDTNILGANLNILFRRKK